MNNKERVLQLVREGALSLEEALHLLENNQESTEETTATEQLEVVQDALRELEIMELLGEPTEEMIHQKNRLTEMQAALKEEMGIDPSEEGTVSRKETSVENTLRDTREYLRKFGQEAAQESQKVGEQLKETVEEFTDKFESKEMTLTLPWLKREKGSYEKSYHLEGLQDISLNISHGSVQVLTHDQDHVYLRHNVQFIGRSEIPTQEEFQELLEVIAEDGHFTYDLQSPLLKGDLTVYLPAKEVSRLTVHNAYGSVMVKGVQVSLLEVKGKVNDIELYQVQAGKASLENYHGDITLEESKIQEVLTDQINGDLRYRGFIGQVTAKSVRGTFYITKENVEESQIHLSNFLGDLKVSVPAGIDLDIQTRLLLGSVFNRLDQLDQTDLNHYQRQIDGTCTRIVLQSNHGNALLKDND